MPLPHYSVTLPVRPSVRLISPQAAAGSDLQIVRPAERAEGHYNKEPSLTVFPNNNSTEKHSQAQTPSFSSMQFDSMRLEINKENWDILSFHCNYLFTFIVKLHSSKAWSVN